MFRIGFVDPDEDNYMFDGELDHSEMKKDQELAAYCLCLFHILFPAFILKKLWGNIVVMSPFLYSRGWRRDQPRNQCCYNGSCSAKLWWTSLNSAEEWTCNCQEELPGDGGLQGCHNTVWVDAVEQAERRVKGHMHDYKDKLVGENTHTMPHREQAEYLSKPILSFCFVNPTFVLQLQKPWKISLQPTQQIDRTPPTEPIMRRRRCRRWPRIGNTSPMMTADNARKLRLKFMNCDANWRLPKIWHGRLILTISRRLSSSLRTLSHAWRKTRRSWPAHAYRSWPISGGDRGYRSFGWSNCV